MKISWKIILNLSFVISSLNVLKMNPDMGLDHLANISLSEITIAHSD